MIKYIHNMLCFIYYMNSTKKLDVSVPFAPMLLNALQSRVYKVMTGGY
jgi:hypothetical protein